MRVLTSQTLIIFILILTSCTDLKNHEKENTDKASARLYTNTAKSFNLSDDQCKSSECTSISIKYPEFTENTDLHKALNLSVNRVVTTSLAEFVMNGKESESIATLSNKFIQGYQEFVKEFPEVKSSWYVDINSEISFQNQDFISLTTTTESYTGGAHPNKTVLINNYSSYGDLVDNLNFFFYDKGKIIELAEISFRKAKNISNSTSLADAGFTFDNGTFNISSQFGFNQKGMIMYYNNYEIGDYANGNTKIIIPFNELGENYRFK